MAKANKKANVKKTVTVKETKKESKAYGRRTNRFKRMINTLNIWRLVGLFLPPVGLVLYLLWRKNRKEDAKKVASGVLVATFIWLFFGLSFLINNDVTSKSTKNTTANRLGIPIITEDDFISRRFLDANQN